MQIIKRKMKVEKTKTEENGYVQASFNSDGRITLRTYGLFGNEETTDEIIVLNARETTAIIQLFKALKNKGVDISDIPF